MHTTLIIVAVLLMVAVVAGILYLLANHGIRAGQEVDHNLHRYRRRMLRTRSRREADRVAR
jgi:hypothetical protein